MQFFDVENSSLVVLVANRLPVVVGVNRPRVVANRLQVVVGVNRLQVVVGVNRPPVVPAAAGYFPHSEARFAKIATKPLTDQAYAIYTTTDRLGCSPGSLLRATTDAFRGLNALGDSEETWQAWTKKENPPEIMSL
jgi:hypothetical protein